MTLDHITIIDQGPNGNCKGASWLHAMAIKGIIPPGDTQRLYNLMPRNFLTNERIAKYLQDQGYNVMEKQIRRIQIRPLLNRGIPIIFGLNGINHESILKPPYIAKFDDRVGAHSVVAVSISGKLIKCLNSWGPDACDHGYFYLDITDPRDQARIMDPAIIGIIQK